VEAHVFEDGCLPVVAEVDVVEDDISPDLLQREGSRFVFDLGLLIDYLEDTLRACGLCG
jgi:hypothetical protein